MGSLQESPEWRKPSRDIDRERKGFAERGGGRRGGGGKEPQRIIERRKTQTRRASPPCAAAEELRQCHRGAGANEADG